MFSKHLLFFLLCDHLVFMGVFLTYALILTGGEGRPQVPSCSHRGQRRA
jgi:hypothetical protein